MRVREASATAGRRSRVCLFSSWLLWDLQVINGATLKEIITTGDKVCCAGLDVFLQVFRHVLLHLPRRRTARRLRDRPPGCSRTRRSENPDLVMASTSLPQSLCRSRKVKHDLLAVQEQFLLALPGAWSQHNEELAASYALPMVLLRLSLRPLCRAGPRLAET
jgi:hypothetical protein